MKKIVTVSLTLILLAGLTAMAADSPQFRGPNRDGIFPDTNVLKAWPEGGPEMLWECVGVGMGYGSPSVVEGKIYITGTPGDGQGYIYALNAADGKILKKVLYGPETDNKFAPCARTTPTIDGDRLYYFSGMGKLFCRKLPALEVIWEKDALKTFGGENNTWKVAESVLIDGDNLICTPGGKDASVVAVNKMTGETVWTSKGLSDQFSYCAPDIITHNGRRILITETAKLVVGINPDNGDVLWTHPHETSYDVHAVTPVYQDGMIYYTGGYGSGGGMIALSEDGTSVEQGWLDEELDCQHHGVVVLDGYIYGAGHESKSLICLELATGKIMWQSKEVTQSVVITADGMLITYEGPKRGIISLVKASPAGFERSGSFTPDVSDANKKTKHWAHPTIANGILYHRHGDTLRAYKITK